MDAVEAIAEILPRLWCHECSYFNKCRVKDGEHCKRQKEIAEAILSLPEVKEYFNKGE